MPKKNEAKQTTLFSGSTAPKKAAPKKAAPKPKPAAEKQPVNVVVNLTVPKEKKESKVMAKPRRNKAMKAARKARTRKGKRRTGQLLTAGSTGSAGGKAYWGAHGGQPKERSGPSYTTIVLADPKTGNKRSVAVGPKGGVYAQKKWEQKWIAAVPLAAAAATGAAYLGMKLKDQPTIASWATWYPGGYTGMALTAGGVGAYVAYKNRYMVGVIAGSIILFYAFIKLAMQKLTGLEEGSASSTSLPDSSSSSSSQEDNEPNATKNLPSTKEKAEEAFESGDEEYKAGNFKNAIAHYEEALSLTNDPLIFYSIAQAYRRMASGIDDKSNPNAQKAAKQAIFYYKMFVNNARPNEVWSASDLAEYKGRAAQFADSLEGLYFKQAASQDDNPIPVRGTRISGTRIGAAMDDPEDDLDEIVEGEEEDDDQEDELVEGVDDEEVYDADDLVEETSGDDEDEEYIIEATAD